MDANVTVTTLPTAMEPVANVSTTLASVETSSNSDLIKATTELLASTMSTTVKSVTTSLVETTSSVPTTTTMTSVTYVENFPTTANLTTNLQTSTVANNILNATASDIMEFVPLSDTTTLATTLTSASTNPSLITITQPTALVANVTTILPETTNINSESIFSTIVSTVNSNVTGPHKDTLTTSEKTVSCNSKLWLV